MGIDSTDQQQQQQHIHQFCQIIGLNPCAALLPTESVITWQTEGQLCCFDVCNAPAPGLKKTRLCNQTRSKNL